MLVNWERYEYVTLKVKGDKTRRKLQLIKKKTSPHKMYEYFFDLLRVFPSHHFERSGKTNITEYSCKFTL
jgi:hypothetical protein